MSYFINNCRVDNPHQGHISHIGYMILDTQLDRQLPRWPSMLITFVSSYRIDSETAFERHRSHIPSNDVDTVLVLKKHLILFLVLKELSSKYGLRDFDIKLYRMAPKSGGKSDNLTNYGRAMESGASNHDGWNRKRIKQYVWECLVFGIDINIFELKA